MKKLIVANWKMNPTTLKGAKRLFYQIKTGIKKYSHVLQNIKIIVCPPFVFLPSLSQMAKKGKILLGVQNFFFEEKGAFTGEISPSMLKDFRVKYVILGHSERRKYFGETDEIINKKLKKAIEKKFKPILCIGETKKERESKKTFKVLKKEIEKAIFGIKNLKNLILAYEPIWAIGTGNPCKPEQAKEVLIFVKKKLKNIPVLYGGSVNLKVAKDYIDVGFDGLLIGGASLRPKEFVEICKVCAI